MEQQVGRKNKPVIILVKPQLGENIGLAARSMLNFGMNELRLVKPRTWPNPIAISSATKASSVVENATVFASFEGAVQDLKSLYATTARSRYLNKPIISSLELKKDISNLKSMNLNEIGIVFGPENSGLDNDIVTTCNKLLSIPVEPKFTSLNIAIAVGIVCYELSQEKTLQVTMSNKTSNLATQKDISTMLNHLWHMLDEINFYQVAQKKTGMQRNISCIFKRLPDLTKSEVNTLMGIFRSLFEHGKRF